MAVPWTGFPMRELIALARPLSSARYVLMETFENSEIAPGQRQKLVSLALYRSADPGRGEP